jgi:hypothetical protein
MDAIIANMAKQSYFDAAHYTWVMVQLETLAAHTEDTLGQALLRTGDYAAPLRTEQVMQPFDNMAVIINMGSVATTRENVHFLVTVNSVKGSMRTLTMWADVGKRDNRIMVMEFGLGRDPERLAKVKAWTAQAKRQFIDHQPHVPDAHKTVISFATDMPDDMRQSLLDFAVPTLRKALRYIPAASAGALMGANVTFHQPKNAGNNAKRVRKGKAPLYEWTTVQIERKAPELPAAPKGGTHASPRLHQRRGHWVTSKLGKRFWRSETVVGKPENGMVFHDYKDGGANA